MSECSIIFSRLCISSLDKDGKTLYSKSTGIKKISLGKDEVITLYIDLFLINLSHLMKTNKMACAPREDSDQPGHQWVAKDPSFLHADSEDSDQTGRMPRLI